MRISKPFRAGITASLILWSFLLPISGQRVSRTSRAGIDSRRLAKIPIQMRSFVEHGSVAGAVTLIAQHGRVVSLEAYGYRDLKSKQLMRTDSIFDVRSVTKPITTIGIMILMEDGKLALNDPVKKYLPEFGAALTTPDSSTAITIHHLLTHTSGLPGNRPIEIEAITVRRDRTLAEVVAVLSKQKPDFEPGTQFRYSSAGYAILGRIIELVSGKPYAQFMKERIFDPLAMKDSFFFIPTDKESRVATVYRLQNGVLSPWDEINDYRKNAKYPAPEFGMYSTASDLASLCQMMLNGGTFRGKRVLSPISVATMTQNHTLGLKSAITQRPAYQGLGWGLHGDPMNDFPLTTPGSFGHNGAFGAIMWIDPNQGLVRIFLEHRFGAGNESNIFMAMAGAAVTN